MGTLFQNLHRCLIGERHPITSGEVKALAELTNLDFKVVDFLTRQSLSVSSAAESGSGSPTNGSGGTIDGGRTRFAGSGIFALHGSGHRNRDVVPCHLSCLVWASALSCGGLSHPLPSCEVTP